MSAASVLTCPADDRCVLLVLRGFSARELRHRDDPPCASAATTISISPLEFCHKSISHAKITSVEMPNLVKIS